MIPSSAAFEDRRTAESRLAGLRILFVACFCVLAVGFWVLQVIQYQKYDEMATNNHLRTLPLRAPRGVLFDRNGKVLVENRESFTIDIVREHSANPHNLTDVVARLAAWTGTDEAHMQDIVNRRMREPAFRPIPVIEHATFEQVATVLAHKLELPEVLVQQVPTRSYPAGGVAAHLFGYVSEIQESQIGQSEYDGLQAGAMVGQAGLEKVYNALLMGTDGNRNVVVNSVGREIEELQKEDPVDGKRLKLTIDYDVQRALEEAFKTNGTAGAGVILDPNTGEILGLTSQPEYDPNDFANGIDRAKWTDLNTDALKPLQNRLIQGRYSPGSTFKIVMATAALSEGIITPDFKVYCPGSITLYGHTFHCDKHEGHGTLDLRHAIEQSCDVYFFKLGSMMNIDTIHEYAERMGLTGKTGIDLPSEAESLVPSTEWKLKTTGERWYPGETVSVAIGQGQVSVTPIALATMISDIANGGTVVTPHLVKSVYDGQSWQSLEAPQPKSIFPLKPDVLSAVRDGLWLAVNGSGTAFRAKMSGHDVAGKTGTAQVISAEGAKAAKAAGYNTKDNGWFVFYAPAEHPVISGVIFAEHGGFGATAAVPIARYVLETFFAEREGRPMPSVKSAPGGLLDIIVPPPAPKAKPAPAPQAALQPAAGAPAPVRQ